MFYFLLLLKSIVNIRFSSKSQGKKIRIENLRGGDHLKKKGVRSWAFHLTEPILAATEFPNSIWPNCISCWLSNPPCKFCSDLGRCILVSLAN